MSHRFLIPVTWMEAGLEEVEADSLEEAVQKAREASLPDGEYVDGSFEVNYDCIDAYEENIIAKICCNIDDTPTSDLPLLIGTFKSKAANQYLEERMRNG